MNVKFLNPFIEAANEVIRAEIGIHIERGPLNLDNHPYTSEDVTVVINLIGRVEGSVFFSMGKEVALFMVSRMIGEETLELDRLAQSGIAELSNVITGKASIKLAKSGFEATISTPTILIGRGAMISTMDFARLIVPLETPAGPMTIHLALREGKNKNFSTAQNPVAQSGL